MSLLYYIFEGSFCLELSLIILYTDYMYTSRVNKTRSYGTCTLLICTLYVYFISIIGPPRGFYYGGDGPTKKGTQQTGFIHVRTCNESFKFVPILLPSIRDVIFQYGRRSFCPTLQTVVTRLQPPLICAVL